tara:strand:- start:305 stop:655 length:351 start_codon:yes stop_codon:yes gene_type:complete
MEQINLVDAVKSLYDGYTVTHKGKAIACIGVNEIDAYSAFGWCLIADGIKTQFYDIHKCVMAWLNGCGYNTVFCDVKEGFVEGHRWVKLLGFHECGTLPEHYTDGVDGILYRRDRM